MTRWGHSHSTLVGTVLGLLLARHGFELALLAGAGGFALGRFWVNLAALGHGLRRRFE